MKVWFFTLFLGVLVCGCSVTKKRNIIAPDATLDKHNSKMLAGSWELEMLFASDNKWERIPYLTIDPEQNIFSGNTGCNTITGKFTISGSFIAFNKNFITTKMECTGSTDKQFISVLSKFNKYAATNRELELSQGEITLMKFKKK